MLWWFLLLAFSAGVVLLAIIAGTLRVRRHMKRAAKEHPGHSHE
jgi:hypothetical protein